MRKMRTSATCLPKLFIFQAVQGAAYGGALPWVAGRLMILVDAWSAGFSGLWLEDGAGPARTGLYPGKRPAGRQHFMFG